MCVLVGRDDPFHGPEPAIVRHDVDLPRARIVAPADLAAAELAHQPREVVAGVEQAQRHVEPCGLR